MPQHTLGQRVLVGRIVGVDSDAGEVVIAPYPGRARLLRRSGRLAARRLTLLDSAETLGDLAALPSNRLEALLGGRAGQYSIRINAQWRICFRWTDDGPSDVEIVDYH